MTAIDEQAVMPPTVGTGTPIEAVWGNEVVAALAEHEYKINSMLPPGTVWLWAGHTAPPGWAFCDGASYTTTDPNYAALFAIIGHTYGGSGTTFKVPDFKGRFPAGVSPGDGMFWGPSAAAGTRDASLVTHNHYMQNHVHWMGNHTHYMEIAGESEHRHFVPGAGVGANAGVMGTRGEPSGWPQSGSGVLFHDVSNVMTKNGAWLSRGPEGWFNQGITINVPAQWSYNTREQGHGAHYHGVQRFDGPSVSHTGGAETGYTADAGGAGNGANANLPPYTTMYFIIRLGFP